MIARALRFVVTAALAACLLASGACRTVPLTDEHAKTVYIVRHAEKTLDGSSDPHLTERGRQRADALARVLSYAGVTVVHVTQFARTSETAKPVLAQGGVRSFVHTVNLDDPSSYVAEVAQSISADRAAAILVVSHGGEIIPALVKKLSGIAVPSITEPEYSRLYIIRIDRGDLSPRVVLAEYDCR